MSDATLLGTGSRPIIRFERHLSGSVESVWRAVTDLEELRSWFPTRIELDEWKVGAMLTHHFDGHDIEPLPGTVVAWNPPHQLKFTWGEDTITFELTASSDGETTFVLTEELSAPHAARNAAGWDTCLDRLEFGHEMEKWNDRFERYSESFVPLLGQQEGPPEGVRVS